MTIKPSHIPGAGYAGSPVAPPANPINDAIAPLAAGDPTPEPAGLARLSYEGLVTVGKHLLGIALRFDHLLARVAHIDELVTSTGEAWLDTSLTLIAAPVQLDYRGQRHLIIWSAAPVTGLALTWNGQTRALTLPAGWYVLDPPNNATLAATAALMVGGVASTSVTVCLRATNHVAPNMQG